MQTVTFTLDPASGLYAANVYGGLLYDPNSGQFYSVVAQMWTVNGQWPQGTGTGAWTVNNQAGSPNPPAGGSPIQAPANMTMVLQTGQPVTAQFLELWQSPSGYWVKLYNQVSQTTVYYPATPPAGYVPGAPGVGSAPAPQNAWVINAQAGVPAPPAGATHIQAPASMTMVEGPNNQPVAAQFLELWHGPTGYYVKLYNQVSQTTVYYPATPPLGYVPGTGPAGPSVSGSAWIVNNQAGIPAPPAGGSPLQAPNPMTMVLTTGQPVTAQFLELWRAPGGQYYVKLYNQVSQTTVYYPATPPPGYQPGAVMIPGRIRGNVPPPAPVRR